jgi:hypothetical protein
MNKQAQKPPMLSIPRTDSLDDPPQQPEDVSFESTFVALFETQTLKDRNLIAISIKDEKTRKSQYIATYERGILVVKSTVYDTQNELLEIRKENGHVHPTFTVRTSDGQTIAESKERIVKLFKNRITYVRKDTNVKYKMTGHENEYTIKQKNITIADMYKFGNGYRITIHLEPQNCLHVLALTIIMMSSKFYL